MLFLGSAETNYKLTNENALLQHHVVVGSSHLSNSDAARISSHSESMFSVMLFPGPAEKKNTTKIEMRMQVIYPE